MDGKLWPNAEYSVMLPSIKSIAYTSYLCMMIIDVFLYYIARMTSFILWILERIQIKNKIYFSILTLLCWYKFEAVHFTAVCLWVIILKCGVQHVSESVPRIGLSLCPRSHTHHIVWTSSRLSLRWLVDWTLCRGPLPSSDTDDPQWSAPPPSTSGFQHKDDSRWFFKLISRGMMVSHLSILV